MSLLLSRVSAVKCFQVDITKTPEWSEMPPASLGFIPTRREGSGLGCRHLCSSSTRQPREPWAARIRTRGRSCLTGEVGVKGGQRQMTLWSLSLTSEITSLLPPSPAAQLDPQGISRKSYPCWRFPHSGISCTPLSAGCACGGCRLRHDQAPRMASQQAGVLKMVVFGSD